MSWSSIMFGLGIGLCTFGVVWPCARHFTGLAQESGLALIIAVASGLLAGLAWILAESRLLGILRRR